MTGFSRILGDFGFRLLERTHLGHVSFHGVRLQALIHKRDREAGLAGERYRLTTLRSSRPVDPTGQDGYNFWTYELAPAVEARRAHLDQSRA